MIRVTKELKFCAAHRLLHYKGACRNVHGHNYRVFITLSAEELDTLGMVVDFGTVKKVLQDWLDTLYDHALILNIKDPLLDCPGLLEGKVIGMVGNPTAENMAVEILDHARTIYLAEKFEVVSVRVYETDTSYAEAF
jgi:6-pyruvoyltetrahydropterin/6-carboxytetrahydropterin synthase